MYHFVVTLLAIATFGHAQDGLIPAGLLDRFDRAKQPLSHEDQDHCKALYLQASLSKDLNESISHGIHSMTVEGMKLFNSRANVNNHIPTIKLAPTKQNKGGPVAYIIENAQEFKYGVDFQTRTMNVIDSILSSVGNADDRLGPGWSPIERVVHSFHMWDLWQKVHQMYEKEVKPNPPSNEVCACLMNVHRNGIYAELKFETEHYQYALPAWFPNMTHFPRLTDAKSWAKWKELSLYYYTRPALRDVAIFMHCATKDF